jgi:hypothetical protein
MMCEICEKECSEDELAAVGPAGTFLCIECVEQMMVELDEEEQK